MPLYLTLISASPAGIGAATWKVACSSSSLSETFAICVLPAAVIFTSPKTILAALSTIALDGLASRTRIVSSPVNFAAARSGATVMS